jgi:hypothetical protein
MYFIIFLGSHLFFFVYPLACQPWQTLLTSVPKPPKPPKPPSGCLGGLGEEGGVSALGLFETRFPLWPLARRAKGPKANPCLPSGGLWNERAARDSLGLPTSYPALPPSGVERGSFAEEAR